MALTRAQRLRIVGEVHDQWVRDNAAKVSGEFDPSQWPDEKSVYNQHNVDMDASGEMQDDLARRVKAALAAAERRQ